MIPSEVKIPDIAPTIKVENTHKMKTTILGNFMINYV
jgi:hypothetical protein